MQSLAHPRTVPNTRELRALLLAEERLEEIAASHRGDTYTVPSLHGEHSYPVTYTARDESCGCRDWELGHTCYHVLAAAVVRAKTSICAGCGHRFRHRDLVEVLEDNHLTFYEGDVVCETCADNHGVVR
jgi:SWIM zinc finger